MKRGKDEAKPREGLDKAFNHRFDCSSTTTNDVKENNKC